MALYFVHPSDEGIVAEAGGARGFLLAWFLGPLYFFATQAWLAAVMALAFEPVIVFAAIEIGDFITPHSLRGAALIAGALQTFLALALFEGPIHAYRRRGWLEVLRLTHPLKEPRRVKADPLPPAFRHKEPSPPRASSSGRLATH
jgi:hypothetical protein